MPYIVVTSLYPSEKADEVAKVFLEVSKKFPPDESLATVVVPGAVVGTLQGISTLFVAEVKKGKLEDYTARLRKALVMYRHIPGYEVQATTYMTLGEALESIGVSST